MFEFVTLRELCENVGVTRRAIQGYEKMGLVKANETNKYGHLLYGEVELVATIITTQDTLLFHQAA